MATRPRGVRARKPCRTRNGSATSSTVSRSSPTATASVERPTGRAAEPAAEDVEDGAVEPVEPELVDLVEVERCVRDLEGDRAVGADLGVVADPAQQPVGDPRRAARPRGDLGRTLRRDGYAEQPGRAVHDPVELGDVVELEVAGEAEPVAQRPGQQPGPGGGPDHRERRDLQRDRGGARPLADDDVDPEVLHREVEHLLGGARHPVDLVDEEDVAVVHPGEDRGEVAGVGERRATGDPERRADLGRDDHRQRGLAEPGRAGEQHVVGRAVAAAARPRAPGRAGRGPVAARSPRRGCAAGARPR